MAKTNKITPPLTDEEIGSKIARGVNFWVLTSDERAAALNAARFAGVDIMTRKSKRAMKGFNIYFMDGGAK